jgi:hypothetical protein
MQNDFIKSRGRRTALSMVPVVGIGVAVGTDDLLTLVRQRLFAIAQGYEDNSTRLGANQRFLVTNLSRNPQFVYDDLYVLWGDVENRIKELKLDIKADRLSCHSFLANQFRLLLHTAAYCLFWLLRHHLKGTELATAQVNTLRLKLLKIGARIRETSRRI